MIPWWLLAAAVPVVALAAVGAVYLIGVWLIGRKVPD